MKTKKAKTCAAKKAAAPKAAKAVSTPKTAADAGLKAVKFTVHADKGKAVFLAGDFNAWNPSAQKMTFKGGIYSTTVKLAPGKHEYKFVIDGTWCADPENTNAIPNDQGTFNSVIDIQ